MAKAYDLFDGKQVAASKTNIYIDEQVSGINKTG